MYITEVRMRRIEGASKVVAVASLTFDECFVVHEVKLLAGREGRPFIAMPNRQLPSGDYLDVAHPITSETRQYIQEEMQRVYDDAVLQDRREYRAYIAD